ncbi:MAG: siroheme synthase CysG [Marinicaulis sp.]|nr:siroheme synthase CysG [Marinicaulis sp.]
MNQFPAFFNFRDREILIIGGLEQAAAKARLAASAGANLTFIWSAFDPALRREFASRAQFKHRLPEIADFNDAAAAFIACDERSATKFARIAKLQKTPVNVVDLPALCDFTTPSIIEREQITIAISTDGAAPVLARRLRATIERLVPARIGALAAFANRYRDTVKSIIPPNERRNFWERFFDGPVSAQILAGNDDGADEAMLAALNRSNKTDTGVVHIVGAGPGDPELLTRRAHRLLQDADVIVHDRLVSGEILSLARRDATRIFVGKKKADHAVPQSDIEKLLIDEARKGKTVIRLKGGDPFIFGRGGEEVDALRAANIPVFVTPGITAAIGCAAATSLPLTHRDFAQAVTFVTGHAKGDEDPDLDWAALAALKNTLVIYMGVSKAGAIAKRLIKNGRDANTPVAVVENGSRNNQVAVKGRLGNLEMLVSAASIQGPAILVIGDVAALADATEILTNVQREQREAA